MRGASRSKASFNGSFSGTAGPRKDIWAQLAGPLTHLPQAGLWAVFSVFTYRAWTGRWTTNVDFDMWYNRHFAHSLMIAAMWVRLISL